MQPTKVIFNIQKLKRPKKISNYSFQTITRFGKNRLFKNLLDLTNYKINKSS